MSEVIQQLDATALFCPDWSLPVRRFLNDIPSGDKAHIVTKEPRSDPRIRQICASYEWELQSHTQDNGLIHYLIQK
jgi:TusA-related sulfurtransferase